MQSFAAPAKLNLLLRVVGRRADGYHLLQTVFRLVDMADEVRIAVRADGALRRVGPTAAIAEEDRHLSGRLGRTRGGVS